MKSNTIKYGFTLIEIMIVIGIIAMLAALTLGISSSVMRNAEKRKTQDVLQLLTVALQEWELEKGRSITFDGYEPEMAPDPNGGWTLGHYDIYRNEYEVIQAPQFSEQGVLNALMNVAMETRMESLVDVFMQSEGAKDILSKMTSDIFIEHDHGTYSRKLVVDAWGTPIGIVFPGRPYFDVNPNGSSFDAAFDDCGDGTVRDEAEDGLGSCINARPYFVSAGPDRTWGYRSQSNDQNSTPDNDAWVASTDNLYSYEPYLEESAR
ncbi:MAG: prepilin-type N-terminal cleavage/methylation domain-containing protein [Phycisphaerae bacterium]|jgi:prepilin-type N-terminal cleavage/methylation domain-containing protein|nr:prepilin-type N-terminal cleavage/methylation domain-containing protein [Phycisphaerae bacterium]